jgi:hypothetical protein
MRMMSDIACNASGLPKKGLTDCAVCLNYRSTLVACNKIELGILISSACLLHETMPTLARVGVIWDDRWAELRATVSATGKLC